MAKSEPGAALGLSRASLGYAVRMAHRLIEAEALDADDAAVRRFRARVLDGGTGGSLDELTHSDDVYALSTCWDLLSHVMEHRFTLPGVVAMLAAVALVPVGIEVPTPATLRFVPSRTVLPRCDDLFGWAALEARRPTLFAGVYRVWCRKDAGEPAARP